MDAEDRRILAKYLTIGYILKHLLKMNKHEEAREVLNWPGATDEPGVVKILIAFGEENLAKLAIKNSEGRIYK